MTEFESLLLNRVEQVHTGVNSLRDRLADCQARLVRLESMDPGVRIQELHEKHDTINDRLNKLERWKSWALGVATAVGVMFGLVFEIIKEMG